MSAVNLNIVFFVLFSYRLVANSDGLSGSAPTVEAFHGENYADGLLHQINVDISQYSTLSSYEYPPVHRNDTIVKSNATDLKFDLDEIVYYGGQPKIKQVNTNPLLLSKRNFQGCLSYVSFNEKKIQSLNLSLAYFKSKENLATFHGNYTKGCHLEKPKFLKSFAKTTDKLVVYSHKNEKMFLAEFSYRTYMRTAVIMKSIASEKRSSLSLVLTDNKLTLSVNLTKTSSFQIIHYDENADDGVWRKIRVEVTPTYMALTIDKTRTEHMFRTTHVLEFPNSLKFGGNHASIPGLIGCVKNIYLGKDLIPVNKIMELPVDMEFEESQCKMKDFCLPHKPCQNNGQCIQMATKATCNCKGTGYKAAFCSIEDTEQPIYKHSCSEYYALGYRDNGMYIIKPGTSMPFKVYCDMTNPLGPRTTIKTNIRNNTYVFAGKFRRDSFHFHYVQYSASKQQILDLITTSTSCRQYFRYDCYKSTLLDSNGRLSNLGVRWYNRHDTIRRYWHGNQAASSPKGSCRCGLEGNCQSSDYLCNCDRMGETFSFDDGYITDKNDLPITKIQVSRQKTNQRSTFQVGALECIGLSPTNSILHKNIATNNNNNNNKNDVSGTRRPYSNQTTVTMSSKSKNVILIDSKLLYIIIIAVVVLISILLLILILKRRICCWYYQHKAQPQIVEIYKDAPVNNNKSIFHPSDVTLNVEDITTKGMKSAYPVCYSESSVGSIDPNRYYTQDHADSDSLSMQSNMSIPKRGILKIKKDIGPPHRPRSDSSSQRCSTSSTSSAGSATRRCPEKSAAAVCCKTYGDKNNYSGNKNNHSGDKDNYDGDRCSNVMSPLKQKVLELSTSRQRLHSGELFFHQESTSCSIKSSSHSSSKESELNSDNDMNINELTELSELLPLNKCQPGANRYVRFNDDEKSSFYKMYHRSMKPLIHETDVDILFDDDDDDDNMSDKTFV